LKRKKLFSNPEYVGYLQNNTLAQQVYDGIAKTSSDGKTLIDFDTANSNIDLARQFQSGQIDRAGFFNGLRNYSLDPKTVEATEKRIDGYIQDSLDPDKAATNWEKYSDDDDFLYFQQKFMVPDEESQVEAVFQMYKNDANWLKVQEAKGNRSFIGEDGFVDDDLLRDHVRRKIQLIRGSLGAQGKEMVTDVQIRNRPSKGSGGSSGTPSTQDERKQLALRNDLESLGYEVKLPSILSDINSAAEVVSILGTPDNDLEPADLQFKRQLEISLNRTRGNDFGIPEVNQTVNQQNRRASSGNSINPGLRDWLENNTLDEAGFAVHSNLKSGNNPNIAPRTLDRNLGFYTNNPLNTKRRASSGPVYTRYDYEGDGLYTAVYSDLVEGIEANKDFIIRWVEGESPVFNEHLTQRGKTVDDMNIGDFYTKWATGATPEKIQIIADEAGISVDQPIKDVPIEDLFRGMLKVENDEVFDVLYGSGEIDVYDRSQPKVAERDTSNQTSAPNEVKTTAGLINDFLSDEISLELNRGFENFEDDEEINAEVNDTIKRMDESTDVLLNAIQDSYPEVYNRELNNMYRQRAELSMFNELREKEGSGETWVLKEFEAGSGRDIKVKALENGTYVARIAPDIVQTRGGRGRSRIIGPASLGEISLALREFGVSDNYKGELGDLSMFKDVDGRPRVKFEFRDKLIDSLVANGDIRLAEDGLVDPSVPLTRTTQSQPSTPTINSKPVVPSAAGRVVSKYYN
jgi:hypothetical protein